MEFAFLGRQPVVDVNSETVLYSLLFRRSNSRKIPLKDVASGYSVAISELMQSFNIEDTLENKKGILKVDDQTIIKTDLSILPAEHLIFELTETTHFSVKVSNVIEDLMDKGYEFSVSHKLVDEIVSKRGDDFLARFSMIVFNVRKLDFDVLHKHERLIKKIGITLMASKVESLQGFEMCKRLGFTYFLGYFFEEPALLKGKKLCSDKITLLQILSKLQASEDMAEAIQSIKYSPNISLLLLKFINSAGISANKEIDTISQAVKLLGPKRMISWVSLTLFTASEDVVQQTLIDSSLMRARMMELMCDLLGRKEYVDQAFMVGLLSLSDAIFHIPMRDVLENAKFSDAITSALLQGEGELGKILKLTLVLERGNYKKIELISRKLNVPIEELSLMLNNAFTYVVEVKKSMSEE